eukprot:4689202-Amphidinium_carterae.1
MQLQTMLECERERERVALCQQQAAIKDKTRRERERHELRVLVGVRPSRHGLPCGRRCKLISRGNLLVAKANLAQAAEHKRHT